MRKAHPVDPWRRPWWTRAGVFAVAWGALVVYGSLLPFRFDGPGFVRDAGGFGPALITWITSPRWALGSNHASSLGVQAWVSDLALNLVLYVPLGVLVRLALHRSGGRAWVEVAAASAIVAGLSWTLECTQAVAPLRYATINDFLANALPGIAAAVLALRISRGLRRLVFGVYRLAAHPLHRVSDLVRDAARRRPALLFCLAAVNLAALTAAYVIMAQPHGGSSGEVNLLPFDWHFHRSYDVAMWGIARTMMVYGLIGGVISLALVRVDVRQVFLWVLGGVTLIAVLVEWARYVTPGSARADVTEPLLAVAAAGLLFAILFLLVHAVRGSCRRKAEQPYQGHERRRRPHRYVAPPRSG